MRIIVVRIFGSPTVRQTVAFAILILATTLSWHVGQIARAAGGISWLPVFSVLTIAVAKMSVVGFHFMEIRRAQLAFRLFFVIWLAGILTALSVLAIG